MFITKIYVTLTLFYYINDDHITSIPHIHVHMLLLHIHGMGTCYLRLHRRICMLILIAHLIFRFKVLPLVLQYGDENPDVYEIPESLVLEVAISHPR